MSTEFNQFERAKVPKDPKIARVFTVDEGPSQQYNALIPSDPFGNWEEWYFWIPIPIGTYYAKELLEMMLMTMRDNVCILMEEEVDEQPQFNSGIYWIIDLNEKDWANGLPGIMEKVRKEIETVVEEDRFPNDERRRLRLEAVGFPDGLKKHEDKEDEEEEKEGEEKEGEEKEGEEKKEEEKEETGDNVATAPAPVPSPAPPRQHQPPRAVPIVDPRTVAAGSHYAAQQSSYVPSYGPPQAHPGGVAYGAAYGPAYGPTYGPTYGPPSSNHWQNALPGGWNGPAAPFHAGQAMRPQGYMQNAPNTSMVATPSRPHAIPTVVDPNSQAAYTPPRTCGPSRFSGPPNYYAFAPPGMSWGAARNPRNFVSGRTLIDPTPPANAPQGPRRANDAVVCQTRPN